MLRVWSRRYCRKAESDRSRLAIPSTSCIPPQKDFDYTAILRRTESAKDRVCEAIDRLFTNPGIAGEWVRRGFTAATISKRDHIGPRHAGRAHNSKRFA